MVFLPYLILFIAYSLKQVCGQLSQAGIAFAVWRHQARLCKECYWLYLGMAYFGLHEGARPLLGWVRVPW